MWQRHTVKNEYQLCVCKDGTTGQVTNLDELKTILSRIRTTVAGLFHSGRVVDIAIITEDGMATQIEIKSHEVSEH